MLAGLYVPFGFPACGMGNHRVELILAKMPLYGSPGFGAGTMRFERTGGAGSSGSLVLIMVPLFVMMPSFQDLARRTAKGVSVRVIGEGLFGEDPLFPA